MTCACRRCVIIKQSLQKNMEFTAFVIITIGLMAEEFLNGHSMKCLQVANPDFPFCLCWANENWTRVWDGGEKHVLLKQNYNEEDDLAHIQSLFSAFRDERYIRINGKPLFLVYRSELIPDPIRTTGIWREAFAKAGLGELYLARVEGYDSVSSNIYAPALGFDADVEFAPFSWNMGNVKYQSPFHRALAAFGLLSKGFIDNRVVNYDDMVRGMQSRPDVNWTRFPCVTPSWDNSARRKNASIFSGSTPEKYEAWLQQIVSKISQKHTGDEKIVFINAWNEWAEGNHLEPDIKWGRAYLEATRSALMSENNHVFPPRVKIHPANDNELSRFKRIYWKIYNFAKAQLDLVKDLGIKK